MYKVGQEEADAVSKIILSKNYFRYEGKDKKSLVDNVEEKFSSLFSINHSLLLTSGTNAIVCALAAAGIGPGDEVIIPSFTFVATAVAVTQVGAIPVIVNIDETLCLDCDEFEKAITSSTKAVIPVHMDGLACDMDRICEIACKHEILVIEDAAQAVGGSFKAKRLGTIGSMGCFSFNVDKIISCGEGGAFVTNNENYYKKAFSFHDAPCQFGNTKKDMFSSDDLLIGMSSRFDNIKAAFLDIQLDRLDGILNELRTRKDLIRKKMESTNREVIGGNCMAGDCGTSVHIKLNDPLEMVEIVKKLLSHSIVAMPVTGRPAHFCWQWMEQFNEGRFHHPEMNPLKNFNIEYKKADYLKSVDFLSSTVKIFLDLEGSEKEFEKKADIIAGQFS